MRGSAKLASQAVGELLDAVYAWEEASDRFIATGSDDDLVVVTHDGQGALIEVTLQPGVQNDLTVEELEDAINEAIEQNVTRAQAGLAEITAQFQERCAQISARFGPHPVGDEMVAALAGQPS